MTDTPLTIGLVGCGKMGQAMLSGWLASETISHVCVLDPMAAIALQHKTTVTDNAHSFGQYSGGMDMLVLAVKPQIMDEVCTQIKPYVPETTPVLSIAAGWKIASYKKIFGKTQPILRAMPNTPAAIGQGITVLCASDEITDTHKHQANTLLDCLGMLEWIEDEGLMDAVTAVSGSGPAYVFHLIELLAKSGEAAGLSPDMSMTLARQTVIGAGALCAKTPEHSAATLRENVTSPGGTTEAALGVLMDGKLQKIYDKAILAATKRGKKLSSR